MATAINDLSGAARAQESVALLDLTGEKGFTASLIQVFTHQLTTNGLARAERTLQLPRNAVVAPPFTVTVRAGRADWALAANVARLRVQAAPAAGGAARTSAVVDFGALRTVSAVALANASALASVTGLRVLRVSPWTGMAFGNAVLDGPDLPTEAVFPAEVRAERLQILFEGSGTESDVAKVLAVRLPEEPADLDLRLNDGPPIWTAPGPAVANGGAWGAAGADGLLTQAFDISAFLNALTGDPSAAADAVLPIRLVLSARVPGAIALDLPAPNGQTVRRIANVALPPASAELRFASEGVIGVPLALPGYARSLHRVELTLAAKLPPERVLPPVGPDAALATVDGATVPLAELVLDPNRTAAVELAPGTRLHELVGVRVPLRADAGGAEVRVVLLTAGSPDPGTPRDGGTSTPVTLTAGDTDAWVTFDFARPLPLDDAALPVAALVVTRGRVRWSLTSAADAGRVWTGPPGGPWQRLPPLGAISALRGRLRLVGHGSREQPVAPLVLGVAGLASTLDVTPTPKGVGVRVPALQLGTTPAGVPVPPGSPPTVQLDVVSRVAGAVTLRDVRVVVADA